MAVDPFVVATERLWWAFGRDALYTAGAAPAAAVRVFFANRDDAWTIAAGAGLAVKRSGFVAELRQAEVPQRPRKGDVLELPHVRLVVKRAWSNTLETTWRLEVDEAPLVQLPPVGPASLPVMVGVTW